MGHVPLNAFLERIKHIDSAQCPVCRHAREDTKQFLLECPVYAHERWALLRNCKTKQPTLQDILSKAKMMVPTSNYIQATGRFEEGGEMREQE